MCATVYGAQPWESLGLQWHGLYMGIERVLATAREHLSPTADRSFLLRSRRAVDYALRATKKPPELKLQASAPSSSRYSTGRWRARQQCQPRHRALMGAAATTRNLVEHARVIGTERLPLVLFAICPRPLPRPAPLASFTCILAHHQSVVAASASPSSANRRMYSHCSAVTGCTLSRGLHQSGQAWKGAAAMAAE